MIECVDGPRIYSFTYLFSDQQAMFSNVTLGKKPLVFILSNLKLYGPGSIAKIKPFLAYFVANLE